MEFYDITIRPVSGFGTRLKGDTLFGHFCWQAAHDPALLSVKVEQVFETYPQNPFAVFSSAFPKGRDSEFSYLFKRPDIPLTWFTHSEGLSKKEKIRETKALKAMKWLKTNPDMVLEVNKANLVANDALVYSRNQAHNTINRLTGNTGTGRFAPFETDMFWFQPGTLLSIFVLIDPDFLTLEGMVNGLARIGRWGFGRDASTGMGRFEIVETKALPLPDLTGSVGLYTLAPSLPEAGLFRQRYFSPFTRFGRHGDVLARAGQPFKNPVIMADEGAVLIPKSPLDTPYVGRCVTRVSKAMPQTVVQAFSPVLPIRLGRST